MLARERKGAVAGMTACPWTWRWNRNRDQAGEQRWKHVLKELMQSKWARSRRKKAQGVLDGQI